MIPKFVSGSERTFTCRESRTIQRCLIVRESIERPGDPLADVVAELQAEIEAVKAEHMRQIAEKESEIVQLKNDIDAAEIRGARAILADFKSFFGLS